jgi:hypothetical protein
MAAASDSAMGEKHSRASAVAEKMESSGPQPWAQNSMGFGWMGALKADEPDCFYLLDDA